MRTGLIVLAVGLSCGTFGYLVGLDADSTPPLQRKQARTQSGAPHVVQGLVCAAAHARSVDDDPSCEATELRARWCESELAQAHRERADVRQAWPDEDSIEAPATWSDAIEEGLANCDVDADLELVDCSEYPCAAALRPSTSPANAAAFKKQMNHLMGQVRGCASLRDAFDLDPENVTSGLDVYRLEAKCNGSQEKFFVMTALHPEGEAYDLLNRDRTDEEERDFNRWLYRRADDLSALWPCLDAS